MTATLANLNTLEEILPSVDAMNRFARSKLCECGNLRKLIYDYKGQLLKLMPFDHRLVSMHGVPCHTCGGDGIYRDYDYSAQCRRCNGRGLVRLDFVESRLGDICWNTPRNEAYSFAERIWEWPSFVALWQTRQPGKDLAPDEVATHMMAIEASPLRKLTRYGADVCGDYHEFYPHLDYTIYAGKSREGVCVVCNAGVQPDYPHSHTLGNARSGRITFRAVVCDPCYKAANAAGSSIFEAAGKRMPAYLMTPTLQRWAATHPVRERSRS